MKTLRLGIDVGGTNTDAVLLDDAGEVLRWGKVSTTPDVLHGIASALRHVLDGVDQSDIAQAMLGTTHAANAVIQRKGLERVGVLRLGAPASLAIGPGAAWPADLAQAVLGPVRIARGGFEFDGSEIAALDEEAIREFAAECAGSVKAVAVSSIFSPASAEHELRAAELLRSELGEDFALSLSHEVGSIGLLERENATVLNGALLSVAHAVVNGFDDALSDAGLELDCFLTQNDGTLMSFSEAIRFPVLTIGSGPTNSMRGAAYLSGLSDALVVDVGGTSTDVGLLTSGFPRESARAIEIGGVRSNFRMPDVISVGLGGGSVVRRAEDGSVTCGPDSVAYRLEHDALVFGGGVLTLSDLSVAAGMTQIGDPSLVADIDHEVTEAALAWVAETIQSICERMKASRADCPLIAVGGGSHLVPAEVPGTSEVVNPEHNAVANAIGAAIAEVSGTVDRVFRYEASSREEALEQAKELAIEAAVRSGARADTVRITSLAEIPMSYLPGQACRVQVKAVGPLERQVEHSAA